MPGLRLLASAAVTAFTALLPVAHAQTLTTIYTFQKLSHGKVPGDLTYHAGALYGTTLYGGASAVRGKAGDGTVFKLDLQSGKQRVLHSFTGGSDGETATGAPVYLGGKLYGTTQFGGGNEGVVFAVDAVSGEEVILHNFGLPPDGYEPLGGLTVHHGMLFGTTYAGGANNDGTVFSIDPASGAEVVIYSFRGGNDGIYPVSGLTYHGGKFFGTTEQGGAHGCGTVYAIDAVTAVEQVLYSFCSVTRDALYPAADLTYAAGFLYGTTTSGGADGYGAVFKVDAASGAESILYSFANGTDGADPYAALTYQSGMLFGTTASGTGPAGNGTVFSIDPSTEALTVLYRFTGAADGATPTSNLLYLNGALYGTTRFGAGSGKSCGRFGCGTVFKLIP